MRNICVDEQSNAFMNILLFFFRSFEHFINRNVLTWVGYVIGRVFQKPNDSNL